MFLLQAHIALELEKIRHLNLRQKGSRFWILFSKVMNIFHFLPEVKDSCACSIPLKTRPSWTTSPTFQWDYLHFSTSQQCYEFTDICNALDGRCYRNFKHDNTSYALIWKLCVCVCVIFLNMEIGYVKGCFSCLLPMHSYLYAQSIKRVVNVIYRGN